MITHLKDRKYYEDLYDKITVDIGREEGQKLLAVRSQILKTTEEKDMYATEFWFERLYWWLIEIPYLLPRWEERQPTIDSWMRSDREKDERLANARPRTEPVCSNCGKRQGLRLTMKHLLHRNRNDEAVVFMFDCPDCKKRTAYWEDGTEWVSPVTPCPKCGKPLAMDVKTRGRNMTTTYTCEACGHKEIEKTQLGKKEAPDPNFERDRKIFCLDEERGRTMQAYRIKWEDGMRMIDEEMKRDANKEVYEAAAKIIQLKIPQLMEKLRPAIEAAGFTEVSFDKPELGLNVVIAFSCMDSNASREEAKSRKTLKKAVTDALVDTNWRLMSDGVDYRLGYLTGRLRAYEDEPDLIKLVS
jgi:predicted RNA-binding Zn-ribbon protein involved in translation (DUF1610 family)